MPIPAFGNYLNEEHKGIVSFWTINPQSVQFYASLSFSL
jgi:hypothetical protein